MAISKIKPITKTLKKAIEYIVNPEKTENGKLVSSYSCTVKTADIEMEMTRNSGTKRGNRIAYHLVQAFDPNDDITPEEAHRIGMEFAQKVLDGKYEFVMATHVDQEHIHNHIIFNSTDYINYKKYHINYWDRIRIRRENDKICRDNGLSVIEKTSGVKGKSWYENQQIRKGSSFKEKIRTAIDKAIEESGTFDEFLTAMEMEGFEYEVTEKILKFRLEDAGQIKFTRSSRIGEFYTKEKIIDRIDNKEAYADRAEEMKKQTQKDVRSKNEKQSDNKKINLIVDVSKCVKAQESTAYKRAVIRGNISSLAETMNFLISHNLKTPEQFEARMNELILMQRESAETVKNMENRMRELSEKIKFTQALFKHGKVGRQARREPLESVFRKEHEQEIVMYNAAEIYMKRNHINTQELNLRGMFDEYKSLKTKCTMLKKEGAETRKILKDMKAAKVNLEAALHIKIHVDEPKSAKKQKEKNDKDLSL